MINNRWDVTEMISWSTEAIIAVITLLVTCLPVGMIFWRAIKQRRASTRPAAGEALGVSLRISIAD